MVVFIIIFLCILALILVCLFRETKLKLIFVHRLLSRSRERSYELWIKNKQLSEALERKQNEVDVLKEQIKVNSDGEEASIH